METSAKTRATRATRSSQNEGERMMRSERGWGVEFWRRNGGECKEVAQRVSTKKM